MESETLTNDLLLEHRNPKLERFPTVGGGFLLVERAFKKDVVVQARQRSWFFQQGPTTNSYILLVVGVFWGLAG